MIGAYLAGESIGEKMKLLIILMNFALILIFLTILGALLERYWRKHQAERATVQAENSPQEAPKTKNSLMVPFVQLGERLQTQLQTLLQPEATKPQTVQQFRLWIQQELTTEKALQNWLLNLPESGFALLTEHISNFCTEMNFDIKWLADPQLNVVPELKNAMKTVVIDYCRACQSAIPVQAEASQFIQYQKLLHTAPDKQTQTLRRTLHAELVNQGLTSPSDSSQLINATEQERQQQALQAIQEFAAKDWSRFAQILQSTTTPTPPPSVNGKEAQSVGGQNGTAKAATTTTTTTASRKSSKSKAAPAAADQAA